MKNYTIAVTGTGYVGLSIATLLSQHHQVTAVDVIPEKVEKSITTSVRFMTSTSKNIWLKRN